MAASGMKQSTSWSRRRLAFGEFRRNCLRMKTGRITCCSLSLLFARGYSLAALGASDMLETCFQQGRRWLSLRAIHAGAGPRCGLRGETNRARHALAMKFDEELDGAERRYAVEDFGFDHGGRVTGAYFDHLGGFGDLIAQAACLDVD